MRRELPSMFRAIATIQNEPVDGLFVKLVLKTDYKNDYSFTVGPTDSAGKIEVTRQEITAWGKETIKWALMDYGPIENVYTGECSVEILKREDLERVLKAYERYQPEKQHEIDGFKKALLNWDERFSSAKVECQVVP